MRPDALGPGQLARAWVSIVVSWDREQGRQVQLRFAPLIASDQVYGGGADGAVLPHAAQEIVAVDVVLMTCTLGAPSCDPATSSSTWCYGR